MAGTAPTDFDFTKTLDAGPVHCSVWLYGTAGRPHIQLSEPLDVIGSSIGLPADIFVCVRQPRPHRLNALRPVQRLEAPREMPEGENRVAADIEVWVTGKAKTKVLRPREIF